MHVFSELFNRYSHLVYGVCLKYLRNEEDAKDNCMLIFEKLITDLTKFKVHQFKPWLHAVARNHCLVCIRRNVQNEKNKNAMLQNFSEEFVNFWTDLNHIGEEENEIENLYQAMVQLDPEQRQCVDLIYLHDKSYKEIAEITGFDLNKVKSCIQNGKRNLKQVMEKAHAEK